MSFVTTYKPLFDVAVEDEADGARLRGFTVTPTEACRRALADHQLVERNRESGVQVFYRTNPQAADPLLGRISARTRFTFALTNSAADLFAVYEPDLGPETGPQLYFDNLDAGGAIDSATTLTANGVVATDDAAKIHATVFQVRTDMSGADPPTELRINDKFDGSLVKQVSLVAGGGDEVITQVDLSAFAPGVYTLETDAPGATSKTIFIDDTLARLAPLGVVDLYWETAQDTAPADGDSYVIRFRKREPPSDP